MKFMKLSTAFVGSSLLLSCIWFIFNVFGINIFGEYSKTANLIFNIGVFLVVTINAGQLLGIFPDYKIEE